MILILLNLCDSDFFWVKCLLITYGEDDRRWSYNLCMSILLPALSLSSLKHLPKKIGNCALHASFFSTSFFMGQMLLLGDGGEDGARDENG